MSVTSRSKRPPYGMLSILLAGSFIAILNSTVLNIALPSIMVDLQVSTANVQWLVTGYMLVIGVLIPTTAFLIQKYSFRHLFLVSMLLFSIGSILAGMAPNFPILLMSRMFQACGAAPTMPLLMNAILTSFPIEKRGSAMGVLGLVMVFSPSMGPTLSGWVVEHFGWRMLFHIVSPIAVIILVTGYFFLKDHKDKVNMTLDKLSLALSSVGFAGLLYGFSSAGEEGWANFEVYGTILVGAISLAFFVMRQLKLDKPMLDFRVYQYPMFALSSVITILMNMALFSAMILLPIYVQTIRGISPIQSGLLMMPGGLIMGMMSPLTGKLFDKWGARILAIVGIAITVISTYYFSTLTLATPYSELLVLYTVRAFGMAMVMMPIMTNGLNQLPRRLYPHGTAMNNTLQNVGAAIGSALLITIYSKRTEFHNNALMSLSMSKLPENPTTEAVEAVKGQVMLQATVNGMDDAFLVATLMIGAALILALFIKRAYPVDEEKNKKTA